MSGAASGFDDRNVTEHRSSRRYPMQLDVRLTRNGGESGNFRTRNICHDGMYIDTRNADLQPGEQLTAELLEQPQQGSVQPFEVVVMHHTGRGIGVLVPDIGIDLLRILTWPAADPSVNLAVLSMTGHGPWEHRLGCNLDAAEPADSTEVRVSRDHAGHGAVITLDAGPMLDLRAAGLVQCVREFARCYRVTKVIVDLGRTLRIQDSGLAILLLLKRYLERRLRSIRLVNATAAIRRRLEQLPAAFEID